MPIYSAAFPAGNVHHIIAVVIVYRDKDILSIVIPGESVLTVGQQQFLIIPIGKRFYFLAHFAQSRGQARAGILLQRKGYKFSAISAVLVGLVGVVIMFLSSLVEGQQLIFTVYLIGALVAGFSMCMLNTVVNPMLNTLGGGGKTGNQLIQFGGTLNSLAATICPIFVGILIGNVSKRHR